MTDVETAWAAGLFEGEGTFSPRHEQANWRTMLEMQMTSTDLDILQRFASTAGCGNVRPRKTRPGRKPQWTWCASGRNALDFAMTLRPYLGDRRKERLNAIIQSIAESQPQPRPCECCEREFIPARFNRERFCSHKCRYLSKYLRRKYQTTSLATATAAGYRPGHIRDTDPGGQLLRNIR